MEKKQFYTVKDLVEMTGYASSKCYRLIDNLNKKLKEQYPDLVIFKGRILKSVWDKQFEMNEDSDKNEIKF